MARINIPKNPDELIKLAKTIKDKHGLDGANSPLAGLNMADFAAKTAAADAENQKAQQYYRDAEKATQDRDLALGGDTAAKGTVTFYVRSARDVLAGLNKGNEKKLGDWGFEVDDSPAAGASKPAAPKP